MEKTCVSFCDYPLCDVISFLHLFYEFAYIFRVVLEIAIHKNGISPSAKIYTSEYCCMVAKISCTCLESFMFLVCR